MGTPQRLKRQGGHFSLVDNIPFRMPIACSKTPALFAVFEIDADKAKKLIPGNAVFPFRLWKKALLVITVINYVETVIGKYIEFSIAIACTRDTRPSPRLIPALFGHHYGLGQYVIDLPVSTEISVKGGKGIWGMPKHQANLDFVITDKTVSSQYDKDGKFAMRIEIEKPSSAWLPLNVGAINYCEFRGMLFRSRIFFRSKAGFTMFKKGAATLTLGDSPLMDPLRDLEISNEPIFTAFLPDTNGILDDYTESWYVLFDEPPQHPMPGFETVIDLGQSQQWLAPPDRAAVDAMIKAQHH